MIKEFDERGNNYFKHCNKEKIETIRTWCDKLLNEESEIFKNKQNLKKAEKVLAPVGVNVDKLAASDYPISKGRGYFPEDFREIRAYFPEVFREIRAYFPEVFRKIGAYFPEVFRKIRAYFPEDFWDIRAYYQWESVCFGAMASLLYF